jgi:hypothetical protein
MRTQLASLFMVLGCALAACGGDDGGGSGIDAQVTADASPDAPAAKQIGSSCTPSQTDPAGDCGTGLVCLTLQGAAGSFCSKTCTPGAGDTCNQGFTGKGLAACVLGVQPQGGGTVTPFCGVVCSATDPQWCPASQCDGTCPAPLACAGVLENTEMETVGMVCR